MRAVRKVSIPQRRMGIASFYPKQRMRRDFLSSVCNAQFLSLSRGSSLTNYHRSERKLPPELFYRLAPSRVQIPFFFSPYNKTPLTRSFVIWRMRRDFLSSVCNAQFPSLPRGSSLTNYHRSERKPPPELFYRLAPSRVQIPFFFSPYNKTPLTRSFVVWRMRRDLNPRYGSPRINDFESLAFSLSATHP